jgi:hypothetical protein
MSATIQRDMNSMFVFEVAGLCIAHLGHLHHELTEDHLKALGRVDVVLAPVDGSYTLNIDDMIGVLGTSGRRWSSPCTISAVEMSDAPTVTLSRSALPARPTVLVVPEVW